MKKKYFVVLIFLLFVRPIFVGAICYDDNVDCNACEDGDTDACARYYYGTDDYYCVDNPSARDTNTCWTDNSRVIRLSDGEMYNNISECPQSWKDAGFSCFKFNTGDLSDRIAVLSKGPALVSRYGDVEMPYYIQGERSPVFFNMNSSHFANYTSALTDSENVDRSTISSSFNNNARYAMINDVMAITTYYDEANDKYIVGNFIFIFLLYTA